MDMKALLTRKTKRKVEKIAKKILKMLIELGKESPMAPVWKPRKEKLSTI